MEKYVSARRLRRNYVEKQEEETQEKSSNSFMFRTILSSMLIITLYIVHEYYPEIVHNNKILSKINEEYKKSYSTEDIKKKLKEIFIYNEPELKKEEKTVAVSQPIVLPIIKTPQSEASSINETYLLKEKIDKNLKFILPTNGKITSRYGFRKSENSIVTPYHTGIDIANNKGTQIKSSIDGVVSANYNDKYYGNTIEIDNGNVKIRYAHLDESKVTKNMNVKQGQIIGTMGSTGNSTGPHLHYEIIVNNVQINPEEILNEFTQSEI